MKALQDLGRFFRSHPLSKDRPSAAWARFVVWQIRSRLADRIEMPWIEGQKLSVRRGMCGATGNVYVGLHEFTDMMFTLHFLREDDLFFDIGANVGTFSILASGVRRATTWAFEPDPATAANMRRNVELNGLQNLVTIHECAVGPADGKVAFTMGLDTMNRVSGDETGSGRKVQQTSLDRIAGDKTPAMLKIDVEGYEEEVLAGAGATLGRAGLKAIEIETVTAIVEQCLLSHGFKRRWYDPFARKLHSKPIDMISSNALFLRDCEYVAQRLSQSRAIDVLGRSI